MKIFEVKDDVDCYECSERSTIRTFTNREAAQTFMERYAEHEEYARLDELEIEESELLEESPTWVEYFQAIYEVTLYPNYDHANGTISSQPRARRDVRKLGHWSDRPRVGVDSGVTAYKNGVYVWSYADTFTEAVRLREAAIPDGWRFD